MKFGTEVSTERECRDLQFWSWGQPPRSAPLPLRIAHYCHPGGVFWKNRPILMKFETNGASLGGNWLPLSEFQIFPHTPPGGCFPSNGGPLYLINRFWWNFAWVVPIHVEMDCCCQKFKFPPHSPIRGRGGVLSLADPKCTKTNNCKTVRKFGILFHIFGNRMSRSTILILGVNPLGPPPLPPG